MRSLRHWRGLRVRDSPKQHVRRTPLPQRVYHLRVHITIQRLYAVFEQRRQLPTGVRLRGDPRVPRLLRRVPIGGTPPWALARLSQSGAVLDRARRRRHPTTDTDGTTTAPRSRTEVAVTGTWVYVTPNAERRDDNRARSPGALKLFGRYGEIVRALPKATGTRGKYPTA